MIALANEKSELWTRKDTISALQQMSETMHRPVIYQATDLNFKNAVLKNEAYYTLALIDKENVVPTLKGNKIASDSIILLPERTINGLAIQVQGFANCSMATVFAVSDQTLPGILLILSILSMTSLFVWKRKLTLQIDVEQTSNAAYVHNLDKIKLTPMQQKLTQMLLEAPDHKVDKNTLCEALWGNKINAEESLYTLIRRTKTALADTDWEIICNRGDSYKLTVKR